MNAGCPFPGCPNIVEPAPGRLYCDVHHELNFDLSSEYEDEARAVLDDAIVDARGDFTGFDRYLASQVTLYGPAVVEAAESGNLWTAVRHALWVGNVKGLLSAAVERRKAEALTALQQARVDWGRAGGRPHKEYGGKPAPTNETLRADYEKYRAAGESKLHAAERAGDLHGGIPAKTVLSRIGEKKRATKTGRRKS